MADDIHASNVNAGDHPEDIAVSRRLGRLSTLPVDTHRLDNLLRARIPRNVPFIRPWRIAVSGLIAATAVSAVVLFSLLVPHTTRASVSDLSQIYNQMLSVPSARGLADSQMNQLQLMCSASGGKMGGCCMQTLHHHKVACMLVKQGNQTVGVVVAPTGKLEFPDGRHIVFHGQSFIVRKAGKLNMVIESGRHHWICIMGTQSVRALLVIGRRIRSTNHGVN